MPITDRQHYDEREPDTFEGVRNRIVRMREDSQSLCQEYHVIAQEMQKYAALQQWPDEVRKEALARGIPPLAYDEIGPFVNTMVGKQSMERLEPKIIAEGDISKGDAQAFEAFVRKIRELSRVELQETQAFRGLWIQGVSCVGIHVQYRNSRFPKVLVERVPISEMLWDVKARDQNFLDRLGHCRGRWLSAAEIRVLYGVEVFEDLGKIETVPESVETWPTDVRNVWKNIGNEVFVWEVEWRDVEPMFEIDLPVSLDQAVAGLTADGVSLMDAMANMIFGVDQLPYDPAEEVAPLPWQLSGREWAEFNEKWSASGRAGEFSRFFEGERDVYFNAVLAGDKFIRKPQRIPENGWTYHFMTDDLVEQSDGFWPISYVRQLKDRQDFINISVTGMLETAMNAPKDAIWAKPGAYRDIERLQNDIARPGAVLEIDGKMGEDWGILSSNKWQPYEDLMRIGMEFSEKVTLDPYSTGSVDDLRRVASKAVAQVVENAAGKHSGRFRALRLFREETTRHLIRIAVAHFESKDLFRLLGSEAVESLSPDKRQWQETERFGVMVEETPYTASVRDAMFLQLWVDQGGIMNAFRGTPLEPPPEVFAQTIKGTTFLPVAAKELWSQHLEKVGSLLQVSPELIEALKNPQFLEQVQALLQQAQQPQPQEQ